MDSAYQRELRIFYDSGNTSWFQDNLNLSSALALYQQGEIASSMQILNHLAIQNPEKEYYSLLAKLSIIQNATALAIDHFKNAFQNGHPEIAPELALAYMENGELDKANFIWKQIILSEDSVNIPMAKKMIQVIEAGEIQDVFNADAEIRFSFLTYRLREFDLEKMEGLALGIENEDLKALSLIKLVHAYLELGQSKKALELLEEIGQLNISQLDVLEATNLVQCHYAYHERDIELMKRLFPNLKSDNFLVNNYLELFKNIVSAKSDEKSKIADSFKKLALRNPFFEPGVMEAVRFFNQEIGDPNLAYEILLDAVRLNPFSIELNKRYALQCLEVGLRSYAMDTKEQLRAMMSSVTYRAFEVEFVEAMAKNDAKSLSW